MNREQRRRAKKRPQQPPVAPRRATIEVDDWDEHGNPTHASVVPAMSFEEASAIVAARKEKP